MLNFPRQTLWSLLVIKYWLRHTTAQHQYTLLIHKYNRGFIHEKLVIPLHTFFQETSLQASLRKHSGYLNLVKFTVVSMFTQVMLTKNPKSQGKQDRSHYKGKATINISKSVRLHKITYLIIFITVEQEKLPLMGIHRTRY